MLGTWGGLTTGGVLYSLDPLLRVPDPYLTACGGVGGLVVGAGPETDPGAYCEAPGMVTISF